MTFFAHLGTDFTSIPFVLTVCAGLIWALDRLCLEPARKGAGVVAGIEPAKPHWLVGFGRQLFPVIAAVFLLRSFIVEPIRNSSGSMIPTLHIGDFILVNRFAYGLRCPVGDCKLLNHGEPKRGDVVVFRYPVDPTMDFIKRVIGLPGDTGRYVNKRLSANGIQVDLDRVGNYEDPRRPLAHCLPQPPEASGVAGPARPWRSCHLVLAVPQGPEILAP